MTEHAALGDLQPSDDQASLVVGGGIPIQVHLDTPVLIGQSANTTFAGPVADGHANATV